MGERALYVKERRRRRSEEVDIIIIIIIVVVIIMFHHLCPRHHDHHDHHNHPLTNMINQGVEFNNQYNQARLKSQTKKDPLVTRWVDISNRWGPKKQNESVLNPGLSLLLYQYRAIEIDRSWKKKRSIYKSMYQYICTSNSNSMIKTNTLKLMSTHSSPPFSSRIPWGCLRGWEACHIQLEPYCWQVCFF